MRKDVHRQTIAAGGWERVRWIDGRVRIDPWDSPDMKLREELSGWQVGLLLLQDAVRIMGLKKAGRTGTEVRQIVKEMGEFDPLDGGQKGKGATMWSFNPRTIGRVGIGETNEGQPVEPDAGRRRWGSLR